ncbi:NPP1 family protein [Rheinheimera sp. MM224]|uniref:NPP1 family protein n=1 Tax=Rheinheimera sp. MM224 TaxID=3019969 RepID=UPI0021F8FD78|nr:NPP1 family protein [Rheinheimera sp. MM224]CAI3795394.1 hypothetical protein JAMGFMIE_01307 [Rheinheimera sp. MM224]
MFSRLNLTKLKITKGFLVLLTILNLGAVSADEFPTWDTGITAYNEAQVRKYHPTFDFDSDGCYPGTPFHRNESLRQNPGLAATSSYYGGCRDAGWGNISNTIHRQLCQVGTDGWERCAHFYELYFEKDQAVHLTFLGGHRHDVETVIVWTAKGHGQEFVSHVSTSAHGNFDTRAMNTLQQHNGHPLVVYHKDGVGTHAFRFANATDKANVEFQGNWGEFYAPNIISHYRAVAQWDSNEQTRHDRNTQYRMALEQSNFGSASFKTRNDQLIMDQANANVPRSDALWANTWFNWDDIAATKAKELQANYPGIYQTIKDRY